MEQKTQLKKKVNPNRIFQDPIHEHKHMIPPEDLISYLGAFRRFKGVAGGVVGKALGISGVDRRDNKSSPTSLLEAQIYAETIGAEVRVKIICAGVEVECPLYKEKN